MFKSNSKTNGKRKGKGREEKQEKAKVGTGLGGKEKGMATNTGNAINEKKQENHQDDNFQCFYCTEIFYRSIHGE